MNVFGKWQQNRFDFKVHAGIFTIFHNMKTMTYAAAFWLDIRCSVSLCILINVKNARQNKLSTWRTCLDFYLIIWLYRKSNEITNHHIYMKRCTAMASSFCCGPFNIRLYAHIYIHIQLLETRSSLDKFKQYKENSLFSPTYIYSYTVSVKKKFEIVLYPIGMLWDQKYIKRSSHRQ